MATLNRQYESCSLTNGRHVQVCFFKSGKTKHVSACRFPSGRCRTRLNIRAKNTPSPSITKTTSQMFPVESDLASSRSLVQPWIHWSAPCFPISSFGLSKSSNVQTLISSSSRNFTPCRRSSAAEFQKHLPLFSSPEEEFSEAKPNSRVFLFNAEFWPLSHALARKLASFRHPMMRRRGNTPRTINPRLTAQPPEPGADASSGSRDGLGERFSVLAAVHPLQAQSWGVRV